MTMIAETRPQILIVDDEPKIVSALVRCLVSTGFQLQSYESPLEALEFAQENKVDLVISDHRMPQLSGVELFEKINSHAPQVPCILLSAHQDFEVVADAFNRGLIAQYISKPWDNNELRFVVKKTLKVNQKITRKSSSFENAKDDFVDFHGMISADLKMFEIFDSISRAATANVPIFISGETGTGKELAAQACHRESYQEGEPFVAVNCANFTEHLMESQLFGHRKGAFTGAVSDQAGVFSAAREGVLFLDEVTTLSLPLQAKLLRVIQEREYFPLGSHKQLEFKAHLITASSTPLSEAVRRGEFREDLYYRLNVVVINLPPLRDRGDDIAILANRFLHIFNRLQKKHFKGFSDTATKILKDFQWPGNVRQLQNIVHNIVVMNDGTRITQELLLKALTSGGHEVLLMPDSMTSQSTAIASSNGQIEPLWQVEKSAIEHALAVCNDNIPRAAALLEVSPSTIYRKRQAWLDK